MYPARGIFAAVKLTMDFRPAFELKGMIGVLAYSIFSEDLSKRPMWLFHNWAFYHAGALAFAELLTIWNLGYIHGSSPRVREMMKRFLGLLISFAARFDSLYSLYTLALELVYGIYRCFWRMNTTSKWLEKDVLRLSTWSISSCPVALSPWWALHSSCGAPPTSRCCATTCLSSASGLKSPFRRVPRRLKMANSLRFVPEILEFT